MALSAKLVMRQGQSLVMTPQLLQAIKLLQFSNIELAAFVQEELERNPLLERADEAAEPVVSPAAEPHETAADKADHEFNDRREADWDDDSFATDRASLETSLGTELSNAFDDERILAPVERREDADGAGLSNVAWSGAAGGSAFDGEPANLEAYVAQEIGLKDHLSSQLSLATSDPIERLIGQAIIDSIDEAGYFADTVEDMAARLGTSTARVETALAMVQKFEPSGIAARDLAECLAIQLRERDRFDPAMQKLVSHLPLLGKRDIAALRRVCDVDEDDILDMIAEIKRLEPRPGRAFGGGAIQPVIPDVIVQAMPDGTWFVELNADVLPKILVNQTYGAKVSRRKGSDSEKSFVSQCLQTANWLTKSLEQRARTILKVSSEIVRQQDAFFAQGVQYLRPLNLKTIADAIGMHESTVSRVTSNKYIASPRGLFELKYFFTAAIPSHSGGDGHSAESVRFRIKQMIDQECATDVLSDDAIVARLKGLNIDIARRTVAKYRESLRIPSSVERRRHKAFH